jgi:hypothetical protein
MLRLKSFFSISARDRIKKCVYLNSSPSPPLSRQRRNEEGEILTRN